MYSLVSYKIVYPSFTVQQIATPVQTSTGSNNPLYNTTTLQTIPIVELPSGGQYTFEFSDTTFLQITLDTFTIQQTSIYESQINQDTFYQQTNNTTQPISTTSQVQGYQVTRQTTETLYLQGNSFTIDTTNLADNQIITVSLPTYIPMQVGLQAENTYYNANVEMIYPSSAFYTNSNVINPQGWNITTPFGIQYTVAVSQAPGSMYTIGFDIPDIYGNYPEFTINGENIINSVFSSTPTIPQDFVPELPASDFSSVNPMQMIPGGQYSYGSFTTLGYADGLNTNYPVFFKELIGYATALNNNNQDVYFMLRAISLRAGKNGIKLYGLLLGSQPLGGYTTPLMINNFLVPAQTSNVNQTLQSNAQILPTLLSSSTSSISVSTISTSSSTQTTTGTSTQTTTGTSTQTTTNTSTQTTTTTNVSKTNLTLTNLFTNPLAVLILVLALIGVVLFVSV